ncbi:MAG TPA: hypothetical protein VH419_17385 [Nocardioidaceae bacterium]
MPIVFIVIAGVVLLALAAAGVWMLAPSLRIFRHLDFDPPASSEDAVFFAENMKIVDGGQ